MNKQKQMRMAATGFVAGVLITILFLSMLGGLSTTSENSELSSRMAALEKEVAKLKDTSSENSSAAQDAVARVLETMSDRWLRSIAGSLDSMRSDINNIRYQIQSLK